MLWIVVHSMSWHVGTERVENYSCDRCVCSGIEGDDGYLVTSWCIVNSGDCKDNVRKWGWSWSWRAPCARLVAPVSVTVMIKDYEEGSEKDVDLSTTYWGKTLACPTGFGSQGKKLWLWIIWVSPGINGWWGHGGLRQPKRIEYEGCGENQESMSEIRK